MSDILLRVKEELQTVIDPEIGLNIVDLGLIYRADLDSDGDVHIEMTLTTPGCPAGGMILEEVKTAVESILPGKDVLISLVFDPPWNPDRISPEGKAFLQKH